MAHVSFNVFLTTCQVPVPHNPVSGIHSCTGIFKPHLPRGESAASAYLVLIYDAVVCILVLFNPILGRTYPNYTARFVTAMRDESLAYFSVIYVITMVCTDIFFLLLFLCRCIPKNIDRANTLLTSFVPEGIRNLLAQIQLLTTVGAMSRITCHLSGISTRRSPSACPE